MRRLLLMAAAGLCVFALAGGAFLMSVGAVIPEPPPGIPPDGLAGETRSLREFKTTTPANTMVTTQAVQVTRLSCPNCESATSRADFWVSDGDVTMRVHVPHTWQATFNVKKQNFVPAVGQTVVVQGRLDEAKGERFIVMKRFAERDHEGAILPAYEVAAGRVPTGTYVWLQPVKILNVARWDDGDYTFDARDPKGGGFVRLELSPPFFGELRIPLKDELVQPYGMVRRDPDHGWYEIHPVRCWSPVECVPLRAAYVRNAPPPGTPAKGGGYLQGGDEPRYVPLQGVRFDATFDPRSTSNEWWIQVGVTGTHPIAKVHASVDGGAWQELTRASWGDWVRSMRAPHGSRVEFLAVADDGQTDRGGPFPWPPATAPQPSCGRGQPVDCEGMGPPRLAAPLPLG